MAALEAGDDAAAGLAAWRLTRRRGVSPGARRPWPQHLPPLDSPLSTLHSPRLPVAMAADLKYYELYRRSRYAAPALSPPSGASG
jgi:hypothetical protein